jgi:hypothetical protein
MIAGEHLSPDENQFLTKERRKAWRRLIVTLSLALLLPALVFLAWRARRET